MKSYEERTQAVLDKIDEYTSAPAPEKKAWYKSKKIITQLCAAAAAVVMLLALNLVLFLPYSNELSKYSGSEYYELIKVVDKMTNTRHRYKNNFEKWTSEIESFFKGENKGTADIGGTTNPGNDTRPVTDYEETTNNQVEGVIEGDLLKRSTNYAYYLLPDSYGLKNNAYTLRIYRLAGNNTNLANEYEITPDENTYFYFVDSEMYLSKNCRSLILVLSCNMNNCGTCTCLLRLDVSDPYNVIETNRVYVSGKYVSSRMTDSLLLFTDFTVHPNTDFSDESKFLPRTGTPNNMKSLPIENIIFSSDATFARYAVTCKLDLDSLTIDDSLAFLSYSQNVYVSEENIFLSSARPENIKVSDYKGEDFNYKKSRTEISCVNHTGEGLKVKGNFKVDGGVLNQYNMDEYEGVFRVATTTNYVHSTDCYTSVYTSASLYCISMQSFETLGKVENFAPAGETVRSARFDKEKAYVCTAVQNTDPVFAFDLSDYADITYKHTGEITGFSTSLIKFTNGTLLGIGNEMMNMKIEIYGETQTSLESLASYTLGCTFPQDFKAYYIDADRGLIGLGMFVDYYGADIDYNYQYRLFMFDGEEIYVAETIKYLERLDYDYIRTAYDNGYIYVFSPAGINIIEWDA